MINYEIKENSTKEVVKKINKLRLENKNTFFCFNGKINGKIFKAKIYNTWLQIFLVNNLNYANCMDESITEFKNTLFKALK